MGLRSTSWMGHLCLVVAIASIAGGDLAHAQNDSKKGKKPAESVAKPTAPAKDERVDISDIENKYWAPKDTDFNVVQNRTYTKEKRLGVSLQYGPLVNDGFNRGYIANLAMNYFWSERMGAQVEYNSFDLHDSNATKGFKVEGGSPNFGRISNYYGLGFNLVPFYAKMSVWGKKIIYFDMSFTPTVGITNYQGQTFDQGPINKSSPTYGFDVTQWFFLHRNFAVRLDFKNRWFEEQIYVYKGPGGVGTGNKVNTITSNTTLFLLGATYFF